MNNSLPQMPLNEMALFFDFDGTLVELKPTPDAVEVSRELQTLLKLANDEVDDALALISGRSLDSLDTLLKLPSINASGSHGMQFRWGKTGTLDLLPDTAPLPEQLLLQCREFCHNNELLFEDKPLTVAIHYRNKPNMESQVEEFLQYISTTYPSLNLTIQAGKCIRELKPQGVNKASALTYFMQSNTFKGRTPWYFGDDVTDEDAFEWINNHNGISIKIGEGKTKANYRLATPMHVIQFLKDTLAYKVNQ